MAIIYPDTWSSLNYPTLRFSLLETLKDIAGSNHQKSISTFNIDDVFHLFFDDTDLGESTSSCISNILFDANEVVVVSNVVIELNNIFDKLGDSTTEDYLGHSFWERVIASSVEALISLGKQGAPVVYWSKEDL